MLRKNDGFTFCECVICFAIISTLSAIAIPSFFNIRDGIEFRAEVTAITLALQHAKIAAIKSNSPVVLQFEKDHYYVFVDNGEGDGNWGDWKCQENERILVRHQLASGFELTTNFSAGRTRFRGSPGMKAGTITIENVNGSKTQVIINTIGRIRTVRLS